ncbi:dynein axonemal intermediate chain 4 isoform X1 [Psammomys obesus]|uniref:dynein axonemal intermediate chain 4 isoform X1 n=1 Tax=Psammomys obesus TaxID=48139 RepID=UPI002453614A|nr:dynein axonemal intermediate chain 4 isoform X1 [Psammomys obesus]
MTPGKHSRAAGAGSWDSGAAEPPGKGRRALVCGPPPCTALRRAPASRLTSPRKSRARNAILQPKRSISFVASRASGGKGPAGMNQSRSSKTMMSLTETKSIEKLNVTGSKTVQVFDARGVDVTPRPLYHPDPHLGAAKPSKLLTSEDGSFGSDFISSYSLYQNTVNPSMFGQLTRSVLGSSSVSKSSVSTTESMAEDLEEPSYKRDKLASFTDVRVLRTTPELAITKEDLEKNIEIILTETGTLRIFDLPTVMFSVESEDAEKIVEKNKNYEVLCKNRLGNDLYVERMMQTFNGAPKNKEVQCDKIIMEEKDSESSSLMDIENVILAKVHDDEEDQSEMILKLDRLQQGLFYMERVLMENIFQPKLAAYRQLRVLKEQQPGGSEDVSKEEKSVTTESEIKKEEEEEGEGEKELQINTEQSTIPANLERLWSFSCDLTKGLNVSSLSWNKANPDLLAVGYGNFGFREQKKGMACCWSIKNPMWPERIYQSQFGVTSVDFSISAPNLLAIGYHNGTVAIYNVQNKNNVPVLDSSESPQKHLGPVWQVQWIEQDRGTTGVDKREILVSISADGRVCKWVIRKGLDCHDLMRLKRMSTSNKKGGEKEKKGEALISRQAPGMCFAFHPKDTNIYLAGTEEGLIHKCSCSYNEQYLETYRGHKGPVYKVVWNPHCPDVFLSCSADWGVIAWRQETLTPLLSFYTTTHVVYDIAWSPKSAYIFAAANESRVEIWDLQVSTLDPLIVNVANPGIKFTTVLFARKTDCLLVGDNDGQVAVYELKNMPAASESGRGDVVNLLLGLKTNQPG